MASKEEEISESSYTPNSVNPTEISNIDDFAVSILNASCRNELAVLLNSSKEIPQVCDNGMVVLRDWRGLAELVGMEFQDIRRIGERHASPTLQVLDWWERKAGSTLGKLMEFLRCMDRFDVIDDTHLLMKRDIMEHLAKNNARSASPSSWYKKENKIDLSTSQTSSVRSFNSDILSSDMQSRMHYNDENENMLTVNDTRESVTMYDAFICYEDSDLEFVKDLIHKLEGDFGFKLFVKDRDMLFGVPEYDAQLRVLKERCSRMIVICSPEFLLSSMCNALLTFAQGLSVSEKHRYLIPVICKQCRLPTQLQFVYNLNFVRGNVFGSLWIRLANSIKTPSDNSAMSLATNSSVKNEQKEYKNSSEENSKLFGKYAAKPGDCLSGKSEDEINMKVKLTREAKVMQNGVIMETEKEMNCSILSQSNENENGACGGNPNSSFISVVSSTGANTNKINEAIAERQEKPSKKTQSHSKLQAIKKSFGRIKSSFTNKNTKEKEKECDTSL